MPMLLVAAIKNAQQATLVLVERLKLWLTLTLSRINRSGTNLAHSASAYGKIPNSTPQPAKISAAVAIKSTLSCAEYVNNRPANTINVNASPTKISICLKGLRHEISTMFF